MLLNGVPVSADDLRAALVNYGHFTAMQVRRGAVQGLDLHVDRLRAATQELFDDALDLARLRDAMRLAAASQPGSDCSLRVTVFSREFDFRHADRAVRADALVAATLPVPPIGTPMRVKSCHHERVLPHIKHVGTFPLFHHARLARRAGFDDALFVNADGCISEGSIWNIGFWDGSQVVWPLAPALRGTGERLLQAGLDQLGIVQCERRIKLADAAGLRGAFACNSRGVWGVSAIDGATYGVDGDCIGLMSRALNIQPWQTL